MEQHHESNRELTAAINESTVAINANTDRVRALEERFNTAPTAPFRG